MYKDSQEIRFLATAKNPNRSSFNIIYVIKMINLYFFSILNFNKIKCNKEVFKAAGSLVMQLYITFF